MAFSRPGSLIRTPSLLTTTIDDEYHVGFSSELLNTDTFNSSSSIFFQGISKKGYQYGMAYSSHAQINQDDNSPPGDLSFHVSGKIYEANNMQINMGINDILYSSEEDHELSLFLSLMNSNIRIGKTQRFNMQTALGFGTGKVNYDSHNYNDDLSHQARFFFGLNIKTPYLADRGGVDVLLDFDGSGTHIGATIPIVKQLDIQVALTNFQNIGNFNAYANEAIEEIYSDAPGLSFGLKFKLSGKPKNLPTVSKNSMRFDSEESPCMLTHNVDNNTLPITINQECNEYAINEFVDNLNQEFAILYDSLKIIEQELNQHDKFKTAQDYEIKTLQDSINIQYLKQRISESELNIAMKHMAQSLRYFYNEDYILALDEVNQTIRRFPNLAIAYARKGTIYYHLGDLQQATINWNLALKHDPEYEEVQNMLLSIKTEVEKLSEFNEN